MIWDSEWEHWPGKVLPIYTFRPSRAQILGSWPPRVHRQSLVHGQGPDFRGWPAVIARYRPLLRVIVGAVGEPPMDGLVLGWAVRKEGGAPGSVQGSALQAVGCPVVFQTR